MASKSIYTRSPSSASPPHRAPPGGTSTSRRPPSAAGLRAAPGHAGGQAPAGTGGPAARWKWRASRRMRITDDAQAVGSLRSRQSVMLRPEVSGRITQINFRDAERVRRGQLLVQLDDQLPLAQVQQAEAELSIARANHKRNQELVEQKFISQRSSTRARPTCRWPRPSCRWPRPRPRA
jgi:membrane fusion protein (multidrug efflux system)